MRTLTIASETQLATRYGTEPLLIVAISFGGNFVYFSDRDFDNVKGNVLDIADLDNVINISGNASVSSVTVTFIDINGYFKQLFDTVNFHKKPIRIYQYFPDTDFTTDKILLFEGYMSTPIEYDEAAMTLTVTGISKLEDVEIGFCPDNAVWRHIIPNEVEPQAWPMPFGTPINYPAALITKIPYGTLVDGFGIHDFLLPVQIVNLRIQQENLKIHQLFCIYGELAAIFSRDAWERDATAAAEAVTAAQNELNRISAWSTYDGVSYETATAEDRLRDAQSFLSYANQQATMFASLAEQFHAEQLSTVTEIVRLGVEMRAIQSLLAQQMWYEANNLNIWNGKTFPQDTQLLLKIGDCLVKGYFEDQGEDSVRDAGKVDIFKVLILIHPQTCCYRRSYCVYLGCTDFDVAIPQIKYGTYAERTGEQIGSLEGASAGFAWISAGSKVTIINFPREYIISIIPCEILKISAYCTINGRRHLTDIPLDYTVEDRDYGDGLIAKVLTLPVALSARAQELWEDEIFVTVESTIGPNVVDIIEYLINQYLPDTICDSDSFAQARIDCVYPANFAILTQTNIIQVLSEISFQACLSLWYSEGIAYLRYLPNVPEVVTELTEESIDSGSLKLSYSDTEDVITKLIAQYRTSYDQKSPYQIVARYNTAKYGTVEETIDYYIYTSRDAVVHSLTFWLLRKGNTWRYLTCTTALNTLILENMDAISVNLLSGMDTVTGIIEESSYNSTDFSLSYKIWLPIRAGETSLYKFAYYNVGDLDEYFPEAEDWATGDGIGNPIFRDFESGQITIFEDTSDKSALQATPGAAREYFLPVVQQPKRLIIPGSPNYSPVYPYRPTDPPDDLDPIEADHSWEPTEINAEMNALEEKASKTVISLHTTKIIDYASKQISTLGSVFRTINNYQIGLREQIFVAGEDNLLCPFKFKLDPETNTYAAKLAYLKDDGKETLPEKPKDPAPEGDPPKPEDPPAEPGNEPPIPEPPMQEPDVPTA